MDISKPYILGRPHNAPTIAEPGCYSTFNDMCRVIAVRASKISLHRSAKALISRLRNSYDVFGRNRHSDVDRRRSAR